MIIKRTFMLLLYSTLCTFIAYAQSGPGNTKRHLWGSIADVNTITRVEGGQAGTLTDIPAINENNNKLLLSWRMLPGESYETAFDVYHQSGSAWTKMNTAPIVNSTNFQVPANFLTASVANTYKVCYAGSEEALDTYTMPADQVFQRRPYTSLFLKENTSDARINDISEYLINDGGVADLDGDGEYEIILVRHAKGYVALDEDEGEGTAPNQAPRSPGILEAYKMNGTFLWRITLGPNIPTSNSLTFIAADYNGDGKDEIAIRTSEGTSFGNGVTIGDTNGDGRTNYAQSGAYNRDAPEFISIIEGMTGVELARAPHIAIGTSEEWGDNYFKRANSLRLAGAKLKHGNKWQIVSGRGVYGKMVLEAWEYNGSGQPMTKLWRFDTDANNNEYIDYKGQGNHQLVVADVDGDGLDEITYGACAIDHDGKGLYTTKLGHGDMLHVGKFDPNRPGLQTYQCYESGLTRSSLRDAATGEEIWALRGTTAGDEGRALIADIDPTSPGYEAWVYDRVVYDINGNPTGGATATMVNFPIWWTGSLNRQLFDNNMITQYNRDGGNNRVFMMYRYPVAMANGSKNNVTFMGDFLGDWREEIVMARRHPTELSYRGDPMPGSIELMIFSTWHPTEYKFPYLMSDEVYYRAAMHQNQGYNSPNHMGYYLGSDMVKEPISQQQQADRYWSGNTSLVWDQTSANWHDGAGASANFANGHTVKFDAQGNNDGEIVLANDMAPAKVWFTNPNGKNYTVSGTGKLIGTMELVKLSEGTLVLKGNHTYTGKTTVDEGLFRIDGQLSSSVLVKERGNLGGTGTLSSGVTLAEGKSLLGAGIRPGFGNTTENDLGTLTVEGDLLLPGGNNLEFDVVPGSTKLNDKLIVNGNFTANGANTIIVKFPNNFPVTGTYTLAQVNGNFQATTANFKTIGIAGRPFRVEVSGGELKLVIEEQRSAAEVVWTGGENNNWDHITSNFLLEGSPATFVFEDRVVFNEAAALKDVRLTEDVTTKGIRFEGGRYTLSGSGSIAGTGGFAFSGNTGDSLLMVLDKNTYTGKNEFRNVAVTVQKLDMLGSASSLGAGSEENRNITLGQASLGILESSNTNRGLKLSGISTLNVAEGKTLVMDGTIGGEGQLVKEGKGILAISGINPFTGTTTIKDGTISLRSEAGNKLGLGDGSGVAGEGRTTVTLAGGLINLFNSSNQSSAYEAINWNIVVPEGAVGGIQTDGRSQMRGTLIGSGTLNLNIPFARTDFFGDWSAFTGEININGGEFRVADGRGYGNATVHLENVMFHPTGTNGRNNGMHIGALKGTATGRLNGQSNANTLITIGNKNVDAEYNGTIEARAQLRKVGTGTQVLTGANTSPLTTEILGGRLLVNNDASANVGLGTGAITVSNGATLGGTGSAGGAINVQDGGALQPGNNGIGTFTAKSSVQLSATSKVEVDLNKGNTERDRVLVAESMTYNGTLIVNNMGNQTIAFGDQFRLFEVAGSSSGNFTAIQPASAGAGLLWAFVAETGTLTVVRDPDYVASREQTILFPEIGTFTYDAGSTTLQATASSELAVAYSSSNTAVVRVNGNRLEFLGVGSVDITASQAGNADWDPAESVTRTIVVNKGKQTINFAELPQLILGSPAYNLTASSTSGLPVSFQVEDATMATVTASQLRLLKAGNTFVMAQQEGNELWEAAPVVSRELIVDKNTQVITFAPLTGTTFDKSTQELNATSNSGLPVTYTSDDPDIARIEGNRLIFVGVGLVGITASQSGNEQWSVAAPLRQTLSIGKGVQTISFEDIPRTFVGAEPYTLVAQSSAGLPVSFQVLDADIASVNDGQLIGMKAGNTSVIATQEGNDLWAPALSVSKEAIVGAQQDGEGMAVSKLITPNGDGYNDVLWIEGIDNFADNVVYIYDRQGQLLFSVQGYNNQDRAFRGLNSTGHVLNSGTYFYRVEYADGGKKRSKKGWFYLTK